MSKVVTGKVVHLDSQCPYSMPKLGLKTDKGREYFYVDRSMVKALSQAYGETVTLSYHGTSSARRAKVTGKVLKVEQSPQQLSLLVRANG